jgi:hypothetical protein
VLAAIDQRQHDRGQAGGDQQRALDVGLHRTRYTRLGDQPRRQRQRDHTDRHVDQEAAAPAKAGDVGLDEDAADQLAADRRQPHHASVQRQCADPVGTFVGDADDRQDVRHQQRAGEPLNEPGGDEHRGARRDSAGGGAGGEQRQPERECPPAADHVAEPGARDQEYRRGQAVARRDPLD